jgi:hypothetical protein
MMFFRRKDLADVEAVLRDQGGAFDLQFARRTLSELAGADDDRVRSLDAIVEDTARG